MFELKTNLHLHTSEDPVDKHIRYNAKKAIDRAAKKDFDVLALTLHTKCGCDKELESYAKERGVLLIPGIEQNIGERHVLILNCDRRAEKVKTFEALRAYKKEKPDIFVIAPHPFFPSPFSLGKDLEENIDLFDAIEKSWFFNKYIDKNKEAKALAQKYNLPYLTTSDTHHLKYLNTAYALINAKEKTIPAVFDAIREHNFENKNKPARLWRDMVLKVGLGIARHPIEFLRGGKQ